MKVRERKLLRLFGRKAKVDNQLPGHERISAQLGISGEGFASLGLGSDLQISDKKV